MDRNGEDSASNEICDLLGDYASTEEGMWGIKLCGSDENTEAASLQPTNLCLNKSKTCTAVASAVL